MAFMEGYTPQQPLAEPLKPPQPDPAPHLQHESGESDEDSLQAPLLRRNTVVRIVGNNRTKQALLGRTAVVKRAVGLGGWHWLVLDTGEEIKLQRNALLVLEQPSGDEQDYSEEEHEEEQRRLAEQQARQRQLQRQQQLEALELEESRARQRRAPRPMIADEYGGVPEEYGGGGGSARERRVVPVRTLHQPCINLGKLDVAALKRYRTYYQLPEPARAASKDDLVAEVSQHWAEQTVDEAQVISHFLRAARRHGGTGTYRH